MTEEDRSPDRAGRAEPTARQGGTEAETAPPAAAGDVEAQRPQLDEGARKYAELENQFKRLAADFENFRRRQSQEREELVKFAASRVLENFLPIVDNFERAIAAAQAPNADKAQVLTGIELIHRQLQEFLTRQGVARMDAQGAPFDPQLHEAVHQLETTDHPDNTVTSVVQPGYTLNGKVLRHAMVQVAHNPNQPAASADAGEPKPEEAPAATGQQKEESTHG